MSEQGFPNGSSPAPADRPSPARGGPARLFRFWWRRFVRDEAFRHKASFLRSVFLFKDLRNRDIALITGRLMEKSYAAGEVIFQEGDVGRACFVVAEGCVELFRQDPESGKEDPVAVVEPGDFFGEMVLLDELPRSATARAMSPCRLYILYKTHFDSLLRDFPRLAVVLLHNLASLLSARLRRQRAAPPAPQPSSPAPAETAA